MSRRIVIIQGHPDPLGQHLCNALAQSYSDGAFEAGHGVTRVELATLDFPMVRSQQEFEHGAVPDALRPAVDAIKQADHIVLIFPLWLGTMPALVKAFLEQAFRPGEAFIYGEGSAITKLLAGKSARMIVTMGMPGWVYRWWYDAHGTRGLARNVFNFAGIKPVRTTLLGMVEATSPQRRAAWLATVRRLGVLAS